MRVFWCVIAIGALGCGRIGFDTSTDGGSGSNGGDGGGNGDGASGDGSPGLCVGAAPATTFPGSGGFPCLDWGANSSFSNATFQEMAGALRIAPFANEPTATAQCERMNVTIGAAGVFTEVSQVLAGTSSRTRLEIDWGGVTYFIGVEGGLMKAGISPTTTLTGGSPTRWWRMRPTTEVVFETSADGLTWNRLGGVGNVPTGQATLRVIASTPTGEPAPGMARFESVNVCP